MGLTYYLLVCPALLLGMTQPSACTAISGALPPKLGDLALAPVGASLHSGKAGWGGAGRRGVVR